MIELPARAWRTFGSSMPTETHWAPATCAEADCAAWRHGWAVTLNLTTDDGAASLAAIKAAYPPGSYRADGPATACMFVFEAGQPCFARASHRRRLERPPLYVVRDGDPARPIPGTAVVLPDAEAWVGEYMDQRERSLRG